ncbi:hypothetical protein TNCV_1100191 [Trichonephila clavipes]|nr:hypothetical protein TNCV_1100191 [Trichonephila clavipes]
MNQERMDYVARVPRYWPKTVDGELHRGMRPNRYGITIVITIPQISGPSTKKVGKLTLLKFIVKQTYLSMYGALSTHEPMTQKLTEGSKSLGMIRKIRFETLYSNISIS